MNELITFCKSASKPTTEINKLIKNLEMSEMILEKLVKMMKMYQLLQLLK